MKPVRYFMMAGAILVLSPAAFSAGLSSAELHATTCFACHGPEAKGAGSTIPALAGYPRAAMVEQLKAFKNGTRLSTIMQRHMKGYSDAEIEAIADYIAQMQP